MNKGSAYEAFTGALLSDAGLAISHRGRDAYFSLSLSGGEHIDWLCYLVEALELLGVEPCSGHPRIGQSISHGKPYEYCCLDTHVSPFLTHEHKKWYPNGVKAVPEDLCLTPIVLADWFMGDGNTHPYTPRPWSIYLKLSTHSFLEQEVKLLQEKLKDTGLGGFGIYRDKSCKAGWYLEAGRCAVVNRFLDMVEPYVVESYRYKIKHSHNVMKGAR